MKRKNTDVAAGRTEWLLKAGIAVVLVLAPFHAFLTVWLGSAVGQYDLLRLWKEAILLVLLGAATYLVLRDKQLRDWLRQDRLTLLTAAFVGLAALSACIGYAAGWVSPKAIGFGLIVDVRMLLFMLVVLVACRHGIPVRVPKLVVIPALVVVCFGLLQLVALPVDFLGHFGYGPDTIKSFQAIDNNPEFPRLQSFLRGPNPLGAYLIPVIMVMAVGAMTHARYRLHLCVALVAAFIVLFGTHSRSAWLGMLCAAGLFGFLQVSSRLRRWLVVGSAAFLIMLAGTIVIMRENDVVQNLVFHSSEASPSATSSNAQRADALTEGVRDIVEEPIGGGVGSAGPASVHNQVEPGSISENFGIQIGQELGIAGLTLYAAIFVTIIWRLYRSRSDKMTCAVLAALAGLLVVNMLSHAWSDDTLAYVFGGLLGYVLAKEISTKSERLRYSKR